MPREFIRLLFGPFLPDRTPFEEGVVHEATNALPVFGSYRPVQAPSRLRTATLGPVLRAHSHVWIETAPPQRLLPNGDQAKGSWSDDSRRTGNDIYVVLAEKEPSVEEYAASSGAPTNDKLRVHLEGPDETPGAGTTEVYFFYRVVGDSAAYTLIVTCIEGASTSRGTKTITGTTDDSGWLLDSFTISGVTDYADLDLEFDATKAGAVQKKFPTQDIKIAAFLDEGGSSSNLFESVNAVDDATYIESSVLESGNAAEYVGGMDTFLEPMQAGTRNVLVRCRASNAGVKLTALLFDGAKVLQASAETAVPVSPTAWSDLSLALDPSGDNPLDFGNIDWTRLRVHLVAGYPDTVASSEWATATPDTLVSSDNFGTVTPADLGDDDDGTKATSDAATAGSGMQAQFTIETGSYDVPTDSPATEVERQIVVRAKNLDGSNPHDFQVRVWENGEVVSGATFTIGAGAGFSDFVFDLTIGSAEHGVTDFTAARIEVRVLKDSTSGWQLEFSEVKLQVAAGRKLFASKLELELDSGNGIKVAWGQGQVPTAAANSIVADHDRRTVIAGTPTKLYKVEPEAGFTDISPSPYNDSPGGWDICSFGDVAIATNYVNAVQKWDPVAGGNAAALIPSGDQPRARFCAPVGDRLMLADIAGASPTGEPDEVWGSKIDDASVFTPDVDDGSFRKRIRQIPGQITRLIGGDVAMVFKRLGIVIGSPIGKPLHFRWDVLSRGIGTDYPWSVVQAGELVYFKGTGGGFFRASPGLPPEPIDFGVRRHFFDAQFSATALPPSYSNQPKVVENRLLGIHDRQSGLIIWFYRDRLLSANYQNRYAAVYNPEDGRFAFVDLEAGWQDTLGKHVSAVIQEPNLTNDATHYLRGISAFSWNGSESTWLRFFDSKALTLTLKTGIASLRRGPQKHQATIYSARPFFRTDAQFQRRGTTPKADYPITRRTPIPLLDTAQLSLTLVTGDDPQLERETQTQTQAGDAMNTRGQLPFALSGDWVQATLSLTGLTRTNLRDLLGIELEVEVK